MFDRHDGMEATSTSGTRDLLIAAGGRVFPKLGYHGTTVEDIINEAGVVRSTFYSYFSNKRELFICVVTEMTDRLVQILKGSIDSIIERFEAVAAPPDASLIREMLCALMAEFFGFVKRNRGIAKIFLHEMVGADREFTRIFNDFQEQTIGQIERLMEYCMRLAMVKKTNLRTAAEFIVSGHMYLARSYSAGSDNWDYEDISHRFVDMQLYGLVQNPGIT